MGAGGVGTTTFPVGDSAGPRATAKFEPALTLPVAAHNIIPRDLSSGRPMTSEPRVPPDRKDIYKEIFDDTGICMIVYGVVDGGRDFVFRDINRAAERREDIRKEDVLGKRLTEVFPDIQSLSVLDFFRRVWETGEPGYPPLSFRKNGKISGWREGFVYKTGPDEILAVYKDEAEQQMVRQLKRQIEFILGATKTGLDIIDSRFNIRYIDPAWRNVHGNPEGRKCHEYFMGRSGPCPGCGVVKALETRQVTVTEQTLVKEGNRPIQVTTIPLQDENGEWLAAEVNVDITPLKRMKDRLQKLNDCFLGFGPNALENINSLVNLCGELLGATCALYNRLEGGLLCSLGRWNTPPDFNPADEPEGHICCDVIRRGGEEAFVIRNLPETPYAKSDPNVSKYGLKTYIGCAVKCGGKAVGSLCAVYQEDHAFDEEDLKILNIIAAAIQIEEERQREEEERIRLENQVQRAQRLESLGILAGGVAHDFNNLLAAILGHAEMALQDLPPDSPVREHLKDVLKGAEQASNLTRQMLAYSGKGNFLPEQVRLNSLIEEMVPLLESSISKKAVLKFDLGPDLPLIEADVAQIRQVVMNLVVNASEALGEGEGVITVGTGVAVNEGLPAGRFVRLEVSDNGGGMTADTRARIFDPFFTTKQIGRGLGLPAVHGIVRSHHGVIRVHSEPGKGASFQVLFPVAADQSSVETANAGTADSEWRGRGTILVADDEEGVRKIVRLMLERLGLAVLTAGDGKEALDIFREHANDIALAILDLTMPRMDGVEALREIRRIRPGAKVILASGYSKEEIKSRSPETEAAGFLPKPFRHDTLVRMVRSLLESPH